MSTALQAAPEGVIPGLAEAASALPGSGTVQAFRTACAEAFGRLGVPTTRHEDWKYTDLTRALTPWWSGLSAPVAMDAPLDAGVLEALRLPLDALRLVFVDGRFHAGLSDAPLSADGMYAGPLAPLLDQAPGWLAFDVAEQESPLYHGLNAVNGALFADGLAVHVPAGRRMETPVHAIFLSREGVASHPRQHIVLGRDAHATVIEHYASVGEGGMDNAVARVHVDDGAELVHYRLQQHGAQQLHLGRVYVEQDAGSYLGHSVSLGGRFSRLDLVADLAREGGRCELNGLYMTAGREHADCHTRIDHRAAGCTSREFFKGVLDGRSHAVFNGKIVVHEDAQRTDSAQSNANLILSRHAEVDTKPELEIYADDVKCAHGATVGQLDADQLFYLRSRGFSEAAARQALTVAFADEVLARMPHAEVRGHLERTGLSRLLAADGMLA